MYIFRVFVEFVALLIKIWPKILIFTVRAKCWREGCFAPPPPRLHTKKSSMQFKLFFFITTYRLTMHSSFENKIYKDH